MSGPRSGPRRGRGRGLARRHRRLAKSAHPDVGGSHDRMARLTVARDVAKRVLAP